MTTRIVSAHRTPERLYAFAKGAKAAGFKVDHRGRRRRGASARHDRVDDRTAGVRRAGRDQGAVRRQDSLYSIVQMPAGIPVGTLAIGKAGAINAALLAASVLALNDAALAERLAAWRKAQTDAVAERPT